MITVKIFLLCWTKTTTGKMTPAYDLTPSEGINGEQTAMVNGKGKGITTDDFIKTAEPFGFSDKKVMTIIEQTDDALADYDKYAKEFGIK